MCSFFFFFLSFLKLLWTWSVDSKFSTGHFHSEEFHSEEQPGRVPVPVSVKCMCKWEYSLNNVSFYLYILLPKPGIYIALLKSIWYICWSQTWWKYISASKMEVIQLEMFCNCWIIPTSSSLYIFTIFRWWFVVIHEALVPSSCPFWQTCILSIWEDGVV